jgi:hypothetical protein
LNFCGRVAGQREGGGERAKEGARERHGRTCLGIGRTVLNPRPGESI